MDDKRSQRAAARERRRGIDESSRVLAGQRLRAAAVEEFCRGGLGGGRGEGSTGWRDGGFVGRLGCVAAYEEYGHEPPCTPIIQGLTTEFEGLRILLPDPGADKTTIAWKEGGRLDGTGLPSGAVAAADLILIPALRVDRSGARLGQGGGWYDRALAFATLGARKLAVVYDEDVLPAGSLPAEGHDVAMDGAITPSGVLWFVG